MDIVIKIYGFRGRRDPALDGMDPRLRLGHVGISLDDGKTIYGFNPQKPEDITGIEFIKRLKNGESFNGCVTDDTMIFKLAEKNGFTMDINIVESINVSEGSKTSDFLSKVHKQLIGDVDNSPLANTRYSFPRYTGGFEPNCYNCATYLLTLGIETPYPSGKLADYL